MDYNTAFAEKHKKFNEYKARKEKLDRIKRYINIFAYGTLAICAIVFSLHIYATAKKMKAEKQQYIENIFNKQY